MTGGLLQLVAYGAQDVYLTGNPQITFFKIVYRRHTNFAIESISQTFNGTANYNSRITAQISRNGDLIHKMYLEIKLPKLSDSTVSNFDILSNDYNRYVNYIGLRLIKSIELEIGGQKIDKQYSHWMYIWNELSLPKGKQEGWDRMVGADSDLTSFDITKLYIPIEFWFCRNIGLALPLISLQYHEVKVNIEIESFENVTYIGTAYQNNNLSSSILYNKNIHDIISCVLWVDYIFLDTDERRRFAQLSHEYLIEQIQFTGIESFKEKNFNSTLQFNHPIKELIWVLTDENKKEKNFQWYNFTDEVNFINENINPYPSDSNIYLTQNIYGIIPNGQNPISSALLKLNGNDRFCEREGSYFTLVQPYQHHTNIPRNKGINIYSFALKPEEHQPSGTLNMSRIDTAVLQLSKKINIGNKDLRIFATNYNVLRILSGMGGLAYSN
jgi:hypothetical protein